MRELWIENEAVSSRLTALGRLQQVVAGRKRPIAGFRKRQLTPQRGLIEALLKWCWRGSMHWLRMNTVASLKLCPEGIKLALQLEL